MLEFDIAARYERAQQLESGVFSKKVAFNTTIFPHWIGETNRFWYIRQSKSGQSFRLVDADAATTEPAFDHAAVARSLGQVTKKALDPDNLPLSELDLSSPPEHIRFSAFDKRWHYQASRDICVEESVHPKDWVVSPDGNKALFSRDYNLWVRYLDTGEEKPLTTDGERFYVYASTPTTYGRQEQVTLEALWSPDSTRVFTQVIDTRRVATGVPLVQHVPPDGSLRPRLFNPERRVAFPGDEHIETYSFLAIEVDSGRIHRADCEPTPVFYPNFIGYFTAHRGWWSRDCRHGYFIHQRRGGKRVQLMKFDTHTGQVAVVFEETSDTIVRLIPTSHLSALVYPLPDSDELIWYSERSGWGHLYLYDLSDGQLKRAITQGEWLVRSVLHYDATRRELFIQTANRIEGRNPYYSDICRVSLDTGELTPLLSSDHEYVVCDQRSRISARSPTSTGVSPSGEYVVTTRSRVDQGPVTLLLDRNGKELQIVETADVSGLPDNWQWPEPVLLKTDDGKTDIYAVVYRPSDFSPDKSYPVIDCSYRYSGSIGSFSNSPRGEWLYLSAAAYAELGFIVVDIDARGNGGLRDKAFNDYQDPRLPTDPAIQCTYNKMDSVNGIRQLAQRYPYMDLNRGGIVDFGSVPMALAGMLAYPEFYRVGVSHSAMADTRLFACFGYDRKREWPELEELADNLRGKLLLMAGMMDDCMPVSMTLRMAEALQQKHKRFEMMLLPNLGHACSSYSIQRTWDYMVEHLLGIEPPEGFKLQSSWG